MTRGHCHVADDCWIGRRCDQPGQLSLHTAVAWQTVNELACGESGIVHGAECIAVLNGVA